MSQTVNTVLTTIEIRNFFREHHHLTLLTCSVWSISAPTTRKYLESEIYKVRCQQTCAGFYSLSPRWAINFNQPKSICFSSQSLSHNPIDFNCTLKEEKLTSMGRHKMIQHVFVRARHKSFLSAESFQRSWVNTRACFRTGKEASQASIFNN